jgi:hypothetical protein
MEHAKERKRVKIVLKLAIAIPGLLVSRMAYGLLPLSVNYLVSEE